jgi:hypothetical protein
MILLWPRLTYSKQTGYLSRRSLSWLTAFLCGCSSGCGPSRRRRFRTVT